MYFLHVRIAGLLGRDDYADRTTWQMEAKRSIEEGATFVLMHEGPAPLRVAEVAPLATQAFPAGIYLTESARLAVDPVQFGAVDFVAASSMQPLYRLRSSGSSDGTLVALPPEQVAGSGALDPGEESRTAGARRGRGRPRKDAAKADEIGEVGANPRATVNLTDAYESSSEFFSSVLNEDSTPDLSPFMAYLGFRKEKRSVSDMARAANITRAGMDLRIKSLAKEHRARPEIAAFVARVEELMNAEDQPVLASEIPGLDPWFRTEDVLAKGFADYLYAVSDGRIDCLPCPAGLILSPVPARKWKEAGAHLRDWLSELDARGVATSVEEFDAKVRDVLPDSLPDSFGKLLVESIDEGRLRRARLPDGGEVIAGFGLGVRPMARAVLMESETPMHQDEILRRLKARFEPTQTDASIRAAVIEFALPFSRSTYGLRHHIGLSEADLLDLVSAAEEVASADPGRQWKVDEIAAQLRETDRLAGLDVTPRRINLVLKAGPTDLHDLGRGVWSLEGATPRRQIHDIVVDALKRNGRPMTNEELRLEIEQSRGTGATFQIQPRDNLIQVARATWGLIERDLPMPEDEARELLRMLISAVTDAGHGLHVDEAAALLSARGRNVAELGGAAFLSALARRYGGLAMTRSRYFVLPEWADERRTTPRQALNAILDENADKSSAQLAELVSASCNRPVDKAQVLSILGDLGYGFDSGLGRWVLVEDQG